MISRKRSGRKSLLLVLASLFGVIVLALGGCALFHGFVQPNQPKDETDHQAGKTASVPVDWRNLPLKATFDRSKITADGLSLDEGLELVSTFPAQDPSNAWGFRKLKIQFKGAGRFKEASVNVIGESVVELAVVPSSRLRMQVSHVDSAIVSLFDANGKELVADTDKPTKVLADRIAKLTFELDGHVGVAKEDLSDGKVWCHNDHIEFNVRKMR